jgi:tetratricopeptide (TPR) repeat protein
VTHLLAAARRAVSEFANDTAAGHVARGMARLELLDERREELRSFLVLRAELAERAGAYAEALADLERAVELVAPNSREAGEIWRLTGQVHRLLDDPDRAFDAFEKAEEVLDPERHPDAWVALQVEVANALYFGGGAGRLPELIERVGPLVERHGTPAQRAELLGFSAFHRFIRERFRLSGETLEICRRALELAAEGGGRRQLSDARFRMGFSLLWADHVTEAVDHLEQALGDARRLGDVMAETRAISYLAIAFRRRGEVDTAFGAGRSALETAGRIDDDYYRGHAQAVIGWAMWRRGQRSEAEAQLTGALDLWGPIERDGETFANVEFSWLAAWPLCAIAHERGDPEAAAARLAWLGAPWERPMGDALAKAVETARATPNAKTIGAALELAGRERLL